MLDVIVCKQCNSKFTSRESMGGYPGIENTVALCPNCHRKIHVLNLNEDKQK